MPEDESQVELRRNALSAFLEARTDEGFRVETRTDTHAIIVPAPRRWAFLDRFRGSNAPSRQVIEVDDNGVVTMSPAEPLRS